MAQVQETKRRTRYGFGTILTAKRKWAERDRHSRSAFFLSRLKALLNDRSRSRCTAAHWSASFAWEWTSKKYCQQQKSEQPNIVWFTHLSSLFTSRFPYKCALFCLIRFYLLCWTVTITSRLTPQNSSVAVLGATFILSRCQSQQPPQYHVVTCCFGWLAFRLWSRLPVMQQFPCEPSIETTDRPAARERKSIANRKSPQLAHFLSPSNDVTPSRVFLDLKSEEEDSDSNGNNNNRQ